MPEKRRKFDLEFREGAVRLVRERPGKSIAAIARDLGINEGTLGNWVAVDRAAREGTDLSAGIWPSSSGCARRSPSCGWSVMSSSVPWSRR